MQIVPGLAGGGSTGPQLHLQQDVVAVPRIAAAVDVVREEPEGAVVSVGTSILGGPRPLSSHRRPTPGYTLNCEEPLKPEALTCERGPLLTFAAGEMVLRPPGPDREVIVQHRVTEHRLRRGALCARSGESWCA